MNDAHTTLQEAKDAVMALCRRKGWGENGLQDPQHVAMAMTVEMSEVLEHFQWLDAPEVRALIEGRDEERRAQIAEEMADVLIYGLQLATRLHIDLAHEIERKLDIVDHRK